MAQLCDPAPAAGETAEKMSAATFERLAAFTTAELGIKMPESKVTMVQSRLLRRMRELGLRTVDEYAEHFFGPAHAGEREFFINCITTNKTDFFREPAHFDFLVSIVLPRAAEIRRGRFKVWSAGCSSGEEPYTLAMVLEEYAAAHAGFDYAILATDVSTQVLGRAHSGIYREERVVPVAGDLRRKYLLRSRDTREARARVVPKLRSKVSFHLLNFMSPDYGIRDCFHAVFFRNVMIYFDRATQEAVVGRICGNLAPGGYLFVGHSESLSGLELPLKPVKASIYRRVEGAYGACVAG